MTKLFKCDVCGIYYNLPRGVELGVCSGSITRSTSKLYDDEVPSADFDLCQSCQNKLDILIAKFIAENE